MKFDPKLLSLVRYYPPDSLDCWRNKKILDEFVNVTGLDCSHQSVVSWDKKEAKKQGVEAVPRLHILYDGRVIHKQSGVISSPEAIIGYVNAACERAGLHT